MRIIGADERLNEPRGVKILIAGPPGVGKTWQLRTLDPKRVLFLDGEAGDLSVADVPVDTIRVNDWETARNIAVRIGGPNRSFWAISPYSEAHFKGVGGWLENLDRYDLIFVDSITAISRLSFRWAEQQPEARSERTGAKDLRSTYGLHAREMLLWLHQLQHARGKHVVFVGILEKVNDDFGRFVEFRLQMEGAKVPREIGAIVDLYLTMEWVDFSDDHKRVRTFICTSPNPWGFPAKDRSGNLGQVEEPHLGKLLAKVLNRQKPVSSIEQPAQTIGG
jgi:hypothetical protein